MKVLVIAPTSFFVDRGTHIRILEEALALERLGHAMTIATYPIGQDIPLEVRTEISVERIRQPFWSRDLAVDPNKQGVWQKLLWDILLIRKVFSLARSRRPDILHAHLREGAFIGWLVQKALFWLNIKLVIDLHGSQTREMTANAYRQSCCIQTVFQRIKQWIDARGEMAVTNSWENTIEVSAMRPSETTETILDGVNLAYYRSMPSKIDVRKQFGIPLHKTVVAYAGAFVSHKGVRYFLEALPKVYETCPEAYFVIAGSGWDHIRLLLTDQAWTQSATFLSPSPYFKLPSLLWASDIGVDPQDIATRQASGKALQYMGAGLPIVCFEKTNNHEYLEDGAEYADELTAESLASAIIRLIRNPKSREEKGLANRRRAERFSWDASAKQLEAVYKRAINS